MNELKIFENSEFGELSVLNSEKYGPLFIGQEVAEIAGYKKPRDAIHNLGDEYKVKLNYEDAKSLFSKSKNLDFGISPRGLTMIIKPGLYKLAANKNKEFEHWIFFEVLPSIDETGKYQLTTTESLELESSLKNLQKLEIAEPVEVARVHNESWRAKLANLINDISKRKKTSTKLLYEKLYYVYASETGFFIPHISKKAGTSNAGYLKKNEILSRNLYRFALTYFYHGIKVVDLMNFEPDQKST